MPPRAGLGMQAVVLCLWAATTFAATSVKVLSPNGGETFTAGTTHTITWQATNPEGLVDILLNEGPQPELLLATIPMAQESWDWRICDRLGNAGDYRIRLVWQPAGSPTELSDSSDGPFTLDGSLSPWPAHLTSLNGGEVLQAGATYNITWTGLPPDVPVFIEVVKGQFGPFTHIDDGYFPAASYPWTVCNLTGTGDDYRIRFTATDPCTGRQSEYFSESNFSIINTQPVASVTITSPQNGDVWQAGSTHDITWTSLNPQGQVNVELWRNGFYSSLLGTAPMAAGSFRWSICPSLPNGPNDAIHLSWTDCTQTLGTTMVGLFSLTGSQPVEPAVVLAPEPGETWPAGSTQRIRWSGGDPQGFALINLNKSGFPYTTIASDIPWSAGGFDWIICDSIGDGIDYSITVSEYANCYGFLNDAVSGNLTISTSAPLVQITLTSPNGGEQLQAGTTSLITWTATRPIGQVLVYLDKAGRRYSLLGVAPVTAGEFEWHICESVGNGTDYIIELVSPQCLLDVIDYSDRTFTISDSAPVPPASGQIRITHPYDFSAVPAGKTTAITWQPLEAPGNFDIYLVMFMADGSLELEKLGSAPVTSGRFDWFIPVCFGRDLARSSTILIQPGCGTSITGNTINGLRIQRLPIDFDDDCDVDQSDADTFKACLVGADQPRPIGCIPADLDADGDVDQSDFGFFQGCLTGPNQPVVADCLPAPNE